MKKITTSFLGLFTLLLVNISADAATPFANSTKPNPTKLLAPPRFVKPAPMMAAAVDTISRWYNFGETMDLYFQGNSVANFNYLFPDSNITAEFGAGEYSNPFVHMLGNVLDVRSEKFNDPITYPSTEFLHLGANDTYNLDSIQFLFVYTRNLDVTDSLIFEIGVNGSVADNSQQLPEYYFPGQLADYGYDTTYFKGLRYTQASHRLNWPTAGGGVKRRFAIPLTEATITDTLENGFSVVTFPTSSVPLIAAGKFIASAVTFKPGYSYNLLDTVNTKNYVTFVSYEEQDGAFPTYTPNDYNQSYIVNTEVRYNLSPPPPAGNGWNGSFLPTLAYTAPYSFEHHLIYYKIRKNLPCTSPITATSVVNTQATCGLSNGNATINASGTSTGNYTYFWGTNGSTTQTATNLAPGNYAVIVGDGQNCSTTVNVTITSSTTAASLTTSSVTPTTGCNTTDGTATANPVNGASPYTYLWSTGATTQSITAGSGPYTVTVTTADGCTSTRTLTITSGGVLPNLTTSTTTSTTGCNATDGTATAIATTGVPPFTYFWSNGATTQSITAGFGTYTVTVTTANACTSTRTLVIAQGAIPNTTSTVTPGACFGQNGTINLNYPGSGIPSFQWFTGAVPSSSGQIAGQATSSLTSSPATYSCIISDSNGCIDTVTAQITQPPLLTVTVATTPANPGTGTAIANANGGTPPYTYLWSNESNNDTIVDLAAGSYSVTITDLNGCSVTSPTVTVTSIKEKAKEALKVAIYPNPSKDFVTLELVSEKTSNIQLRVFSINGQEVFSDVLHQNAGKNIYTIDLNNFSKGVYYIQLTNEKSSITKKLIKN
jgi:hypothetical protein